MATVVRIEDAVVRRGATLLLDRVSLSVGEGERWVVMGPNGAGKTTMLLMAAGRLFPTAGRVEVLEEELGAVDVAIRPEAITVEAAPGPAGSLSGRVAKASYLGTHMEYSVETAAGLLFATCPRVDRPLAAGDAVGLVLAPRGVLLLRG